MQNSNNFWTCVVLCSICFSKKNAMHGHALKANKKACFFSHDVFVQCAVIYIQKHVSRSLKPLIIRRHEENESPTAMGTVLLAQFMLSVVD